MMPQDTALFWHYALSAYASRAGDAAGDIHPSSVGCQIVYVFKRPTLPKNLIIYSRTAA